MLLFHGEVGNIQSSLGSEYCCIGNINAILLHPKRHENMTFQALVLKFPFYKGATLPVLTPGKKEQHYQSVYTNFCCRIV